MMLSIMSLIRETLGTEDTAKESPNAAQTPTTHGAAAVKVESENDFRAILSEVPTSAQPCMSAHRIKTATSHAANEDGDEHETTCMSPDDFLAWAFNAQSATQTLPAPTPIATGSSTTLHAVKGGNAALHAIENATTEDIRGFDGREIFASRENDGSIQPQASILEPLLPNHAQAPASDQPASGDFATASPNAAGAAHGSSDGDRVSFTKLARSKNATEVPPPSVLPTVEADDIAPPTTRTDLRATVMAPPHGQLPREAHPTTQMAAMSEPPTAPGPRIEDILAPARMIAQTNAAAAPQREHVAGAHASNDLHELPTRPEMRAKSIDPRPVSAKTEPSLEAQPAPAATATPAARVVPVMLPPLTSHDTVAMPRVDMSANASANANDARDASDARQRAAVHAVNQLTLKKSAGGEIEIPELGKVRVEAEAKAGRVDVSIQADRSETRALMSAHTREITADARAAAIPVNAVRVAGANGSGNATTNFSSSSQDAPRRENDRAERDEPAQKNANAPLANKRARFVL